MAYLTYDEYKELGGDLSETAFNLAEFKAEKRIDYLTDSRVRGMNTVPQAVKLCVFVVIGMDSVVGTEAQVANPIITSFNNDGYSESYGNVMRADEATKAMNATVREYLYGEVDDYGVPLLYRGI